MAVPAQATALGDGATAAPWVTLDSDGKRRRLLDAAELVFARDGLDATVPSIAATAGAGVGSVYRAFASKEEIICALAVERLHWVCERAGEALGARDAWAGFERLLRVIAERQLADGVLGEAFAAAFRRPDLAEPRAAALTLARDARDRPGQRPGDHQQADDEHPEAGPQVDVHPGGLVLDLVAADRTGDHEHDPVEEEEAADDAADVEAVRRPRRRDVIEFVAFGHGCPPTGR